MVIEIWVKYNKNLKTEAIKKGACLEELRNLKLSRIIVTRSWGLGGTLKIQSSCKLKLEC